MNDLTLIPSDRADAQTYGALFNEILTNPRHPQHAAVTREYQSLVRGEARARGVDLDAPMVNGVALGQR